MSEKLVKRRSDQKTTGTDRGNTGLMSTAGTWVSGNSSALLIALMHPKGTTYENTTGTASERKGAHHIPEPAQK
jgi:hypothetical protein